MPSGDTLNNLQVRAAPAKFDEGSLEHAFIASLGYLSDQNKLDLSIPHGDGTNTVAKKGGDGIGVGRGLLALQCLGHHVPLSPRRRCGEDTLITSYWSPANSLVFR
jgi:hypothetical protein